MAGQGRMFVDQSLTDVGRHSIGEDERAADDAQLYVFESGFWNYVESV